MYSKNNTSSSIIDCENRIDVARFLAGLDGEVLKLANCIMSGCSVRMWALQTGQTRHKAYKIYRDLKVKAERYFV